MKFGEVKVAIYSDNLRDPLNQRVALTIGLRDAKTGQWSVARPVELDFRVIDEGATPVEPTLVMNWDFAEMFFVALAEALVGKGYVPSRDQITDAHQRADKAIASVEAKDLEIEYLRNLVNRLLSAGKQDLVDRLLTMLEGRKPNVQSNNQ